MAHSLFAIKYWVIARKLTDVPKSFETKAQTILIA
jgi:hypothetical protein